MGEQAHLVTDGGDHAGVAVADVEHRDPGQEVQVLVALGVPQPHARAADELDRGAGVGADGVAALELLELLERRALIGRAAAHVAGPIFVPCPASVNSSSSSECGTRPSTMWA